MEMDPGSKATEEILRLWGWVLSQLENRSVDQPVSLGGQWPAETRH